MTEGEKLRGSLPKDKNGSKKFKRYNKAMQKIQHNPLDCHPQLLYEEWANYGVFYKYQPIGLVR